jgi:tetratricopeptide (TPR) repeat protein
MIKTIKKFFSKLFWFPTDSNILNKKGVIELNARRYESSLTYFKEALKANPKNVNVLNNEGVALNDIANMKEGKEADDLFNQSFEKLIKAEKIKGGAGTYNIACLYSLKGNVNESLAWLEKCLKNNSIPSRSHILADSDLDNIKNKDEFLTLIAIYR